MDTAQAPPTEVKPTSVTSPAAPAEKPTSPKAAKKEIGYIVSASDYLIYIEGLPTAHVNDIIVDADDNRALVTALDREKVEAVMLDPIRPKPGDSFTLTGGGLHINISDALIGRAINPLGFPLDGLAPLPPGGELVDLDLVAPGIDARKFIKDQLETGITTLDTLVPIARGQRELIFGAPRAGKTQVLLDIILAQKGKNIICIYCAMGRSEIDVKRFMKNLAVGGATEYTIVIAASSSEAAPLISITPQVAFTVAEWYRNKGKELLLILDDLGMYAKYVREIGLLSGRIPGRESYPADIFYQFSSQLERGGSFNEHFQNGAITLLPVIETDLENFTSLVPTTLMSITDGHVLFDAALRAQGRYPAIDPERSVTRVGRQVQSKLMKVVSDKIRSLLADFTELEKYASFGSELTAETQLTLKRGNVAKEFIKQNPGEQISIGVQLLMLGLIFTPYFNDKDLGTIKVNKKTLLKVFEESDEFKAVIEKEKDVDFEGLVKLLTEKIPVLEEKMKAALPATQPTTTQPAATPPATTPATTVPATTSSAAPPQPTTPPPTTTPSPPPPASPPPVNTAAPAPEAPKK